MAHTRKHTIKTLDIIRENNMIPKSSKYKHLNKKVLFKRWDLIPRYLAIENHFGENDYGWDLFRKLRTHQASEFGDGTVQSEYDQSVRTNFESLIESVGANGYDRKHPLVVHDQPDGHVRLARLHPDPELPGAREHEPGAILPRDPRPPTAPDQSLQGRSPIRLFCRPVTQPPGSGHRC